MPVLRRIPMVVLTIVLGVRGPGLVTTDEQKRKLVPLTSISSTSTLSEKAGHSVWKYLIPPSGIPVVVLSPGSMIAGAGGVKGEGEGEKEWIRLLSGNIFFTGSITCA